MMAKVDFGTFAVDVSKQIALLIRSLSAESGSSSTIAMSLANFG
jgi:hypothetical protein